jgi:hypothetical protein
MRQIVKHLHAAKCEVIVLGAIPFFSGAKKTSVDDRRRFDLLNVALREYTDAAAKALHGLHATFVDAQVVLRARPDCFSSDGEDLSDDGTAALADALARSMQAPQGASM